MDVAIVGGHGKIALVLTRLLHERGDRVRSVVRKAEQSADVRAAGSEPVLCDIEAASPEDLADALGSASAVVFAAGAGAGSGPERKETVDYGGAAKSMEAAKIKGIRRYLMISAVAADPRAEGADTFAVYLRAKGRADEDLVKSGLDYTIVRPTRLTDDPGVGLVRIATDIGRGTIARDDVAAVLSASLHERRTISKVFDVTGGHVPIEEALRNL